MNSLILAVMLVTGVNGWSGENESDREERYAPFGCEVSASGTILYERGNRINHYTSTLKLSGSESTLKVAGFTNKVDKLHIHKDRSGRRVMSMLFRNPPAVAENTSVLLIGTIKSDGVRRHYYGDIYETSGKHEDVCSCEDWHDPISEDVKWVHKGGFHYTSNVY